MDNLAKREKQQSVLRVIEMPSHTVLFTDFAFGDIDSSV
jgi:hypothetical protein